MASSSSSSTSSFVLRRCSQNPTKPPPPPTLLHSIPDTDDEETDNSAGEEASSTGAGLKRKKSKGKGKIFSRSSSSWSSSRKRRGGLRLRSGKGSVCVWGGSRGDGRVESVALPLGMAIAAIIAQASTRSSFPPLRLMNKVEEKNSVGQRIPVDHLSVICISAVKEAVSNAYGKRFECFLSNFEKSFHSTLKTLRVIYEGNPADPRNQSGPSFIKDNFKDQTFQAFKETPVSFEHVKQPEENQAVIQEDNQLALVGGPVNQQLAHFFHRNTDPGYSQSVLSTFEKSVSEQTRSNDLKEFELGLKMKSLQLKQSQIDLNSFSNMLENVKLSMGFFKARFKEEKLKTQMQDVRHAELLRRCIDLLVAGLLIMSSSLAYGASIYSYERIAEATASCTSHPKENKAWWYPKQMASFNSSWMMLRCHAIVLTRMLFGILMIVVIAYSLFQRSAAAGQMMPVTFILLILGAICGGVGKLCIDTLGGSGYRWLLYWETLCLLHFLVNAFPSIIYHLLFGPVCGHQQDKGSLPPYWLRRSVFYSILLVILPVFSGLLPFASLYDWRDHFIDKAISSD